MFVSGLNSKHTAIIKLTQLRRHFGLLASCTLGINYSYSNTFFFIFLFFLDRQFWLVDHSRLCTADDPAKPIVAKTRLLIAIYSRWLVEQVVSNDEGTRNEMERFIADDTLTQYWCCRRSRITARNLSAWPINSGDVIRNGPCVPGCEGFVWRKVVGCS